MILSQEKSLSVDQELFVSSMRNYGEVLHHI